MQRSIFVAASVLTVSATDIFWIQSAKGETCTKTCTDLTYTCLPGNWPGDAASTYDATRAATVQGCDEIKTAAAASAAAAPYIEIAGNTRRCTYALDAAGDSPTQKCGASSS